MSVTEGQGANTTAPLMETGIAQSSVLAFNLDE
jgi:hypothetical protein